MTTLHMIATIISTHPGAASYWQYLNTLQHMHQTCGVVVVPEDSTQPSYALFGGSCSQAFNMAVQMHDPFISFVSDQASAALAAVTGVFGY